jgi:hypothetical protein
MNRYCGTKSSSITITILSSLSTTTRTVPKKGTHKSTSSSFQLSRRSREGMMTEVLSLFYAAINIILLSKYYLTIHSQRIQMIKKSN